MNCRYIIDSEIDQREVDRMLALISAILMILLACLFVKIGFAILILPFRVGWWFITLPLRILFPRWFS